MPDPLDKLSDAIFPKVHKCVTCGAKVAGFTALVEHIKEEHP